MKTILKTTVFAVISALVAIPSVSLADTTPHPYKVQLISAQTKRECKSSSSSRNIPLGAVTGGAIGALGGYLTGNAGQGALIGAGVGAADRATRHSGNVGIAAAEGGGVGALGGLITGNAGRGALIGAGVGAADRAITGNNKCH